MRQAPLQKPRGVSPSPFMVGGAAKGLWKGLAFIAPFASQKGAGRVTLLDAGGRPLANSNLVAGSTLQWRGTPYGLGVGISGASNLLTQDNFAPVTTSDGAYTGDFTFACYANPPAEARSSVCVAQETSNSFPRGYMGWNLSNTSGRFGISTQNSAGTSAINVENVVDGRYHVYAGRREATNLSLWVDGVSRTTSSMTVRAIGGGSAGMAIGSAAEVANGARIATTTNIAFVAAWNRALSDAEMRMLGRDPFCMFRPVRTATPLYVVAASGITGTLEVTEADDTLAATGALSIAGLAAITEGADTLSSTGTVALAGAASITEAADTVSAIGGSGTTGELAVTEAADTVSSAATLAISAAASITEAADTLSAAGGEGGEVVVISEWIIRAKRRGRR